MTNNKPFKINRGSSKGSLWQVIALIFFALTISLIIAVVWQKAAGDTAMIPPISSRTKNLSASTSASSQEPSSEAESPSQPKPEPEPPFVSKVPASERAASTYFDDAVFVGDSITTGIQLYGMMANTTVLAGTGINLDTLYTSQVVKQEDGTRITIMDGLRNKKFKKVYILLGGNEVRDVEQDIFISRYRKVLADVAALQPDALIYVQSITPVTKANNYNMDNERIDKFNDALIQLCDEEQYHYVNIAEAMKGEDGMLPDAASPKDGMHFGPEYYTKWFDYLKTHTVSLPDSDADSSGENNEREQKI